MTASPLQPVRFNRIELRDFRNLADVAFDPAPKLNVVFGDNGQGKTSLLESLYFVATTRSFRSERLQTLIRQGAGPAIVRADVEESGYRREQRALLSKAGRRMSLDGKRPERLIDYALKTPVVAFHPNDLELVSGSASTRRRLLDRVALYVDPSGFERRGLFERAAKERQRVLLDRGEHAPELEAYEALIAEHGARWQTARERAAGALIAA
ncbi:MAG TPA: AAA family ATPase, partial [Polyangiaceae bacterium]